YSSFFFSSRRRHTRFSRDWSSDVCSSDLSDQLAVPEGLGTIVSMALRRTHVCVIDDVGGLTCWGINNYGQTDVPDGLGVVTEVEIGRASCRESGWLAVGVVVTEIEYGGRS